MLRLFTAWYNFFFYFIFYFHQLVFDNGDNSLDFFNQNGL